MGSSFACQITRNDSPHDADSGASGCSIRRRPDSHTRTAASPDATSDRSEDQEPRSCLYLYVHPLQLAVVKAGKKGEIGRNSLTKDHISTHRLQQVVPSVRLIPAETVQYQVHAFRTDPVFQDGTRAAGILPVT